MALNEVEKLKKINAALMEQVERSMDQQGNAFSLFQTAIGLEKQVRERTDELAMTLRRLEESNLALNTAKDAAEKANISKTRFLAAASHDVLQPLNAASLSISALADLQTTQQGKNLAQQVQKSLATMDDLLKTLLDISKLDSGAMQPARSCVSLNATLDGLRADFEPLAHERNLSIRFRPTDLHVDSDRTMLRRIMQNLVSNAICYTQSGGILVGARERGRRVRIDVVDTGIGIPPEQLDTVFEEFFRGRRSDASDLGNQAGLGLGLSIVRRMVDALDHDLKLRSEPERGTVFSLCLPRREPPVEAHTAIGNTGEDVPPATLSGVRALLVENDLPVLQAMATLLERWRCDVRLAAGVEEVRDLLSHDRWSPDIILADQQLDHGGLGTELICDVRRRLKRPIPAIVITADPTDEIRAAIAGTDIELMHKPLKPAELRAIMSYLLTSSARSGVGSAQSPASARKV